MYKSVTLEEDLALKKIIGLPSEQKLNFQWSQSIENQHATIESAVIVSSGREIPVSFAEIAETIGGALTDLLSAKNKPSEEIFSTENRRLVAEMTASVAREFGRQIQPGGGLKLSSNDFDLLIEKVLIEHEAFDIAKALIFRRALEKTNELETAAMDLGEQSAQVRLIRRNGRVVPWNEAKIELAVRKAFLSIKQDSEFAVSIARSVTERVRGAENAFVHIEDVQDFVQEELMKQGYFKAAEAYILYRAQRAQFRAEVVPSADEAGQEAMIVITKPDGTSSLWDGSELRKRIGFAMIGLDLCLSEAEIEAELRRSVPSETTESDLKSTIILNAKSLIEQDADFAKFSGRILLSYIYEEVLDWSIVHDGIERLRDAHRVHFKVALKQAVAIHRIAPQLLEFNLEKLAENLDPTADFDLDYLGIQTLYDRYLLIDKTGKKPRRLETPQLFWMRVAMGIFRQEPCLREEWTIRLYQLYKGRKFCSSTPTLFNSGTLHSQLSSCYLYKVDDSIESIMIRGIAENAFLSKWAGGLGGSWTSVRGVGSYIKGTNGESQGVIPFLKLHNDQLVAVNQGGKRRGSGCAYLESWHNDIEDFLELRKNTGDERRRTHDMNTANWIPDLFMKRMELREHWTLFRSNEVADLPSLYGRAFEKRYVEYEKLAAEGKIWSKTVPALELWKQMLKMIFETGHPWITFKDPCNVRSPQDHVGVIHSSNLCTEITLNTSADETAVCNLGSVVLDNHMKPDGSLDHEALKETISVAVRALDNVIDINFYPTEAASRANSRHRPIGLGVMGLQNALYKKGLAFASQEAVEFNDELMEAIAYYAYEASSDLAAERGKYSSYEGSKWSRGLMPHDTLKLLEQERGIPLDIVYGEKLDWQPLREKIARQGMRNSNVLAIAPTATISNIMGTTPCIEPNYKNLYVKSNLSGDFIVLNRELVKDLKLAGLWSRQMLDQLKYFDGELDSISEIPESLKQKHKTVFGIDHEYIIDAAARRQKWIDQAQSVNLFLALPDMKTLSHMYRRAWRTGLKTTYYLRSLQASNIEKATIDVKKQTRGVVAQAQAQAAAENSRQSTEAEKFACSIEARLNGEECEACQ